MYGLADPTLGKSDPDVSNVVMKVLHSKGLHEQFLGALLEETGALPPIVVAALDATATCSQPSYSGAKRIDLADPTATV